MKGFCESGVYLRLPCVRKKRGRGPLRYHQVSNALGFSLEFHTSANSGASTSSTLRQ